MKQVENRTKILGEKQAKNDELLALKTKELDSLRETLKCGIF